MEVKSIAETTKPKFLRFAPGEVIKTLLTNLAEYREVNEGVYNLLIDTDENNFSIMGNGHGECLVLRFNEFRINKNILAIRYLNVPGVYVFERNSEDDIWVGNRILNEEATYFVFSNALLLDREEDKVTVSIMNGDFGIETILKFKSIIET